MLPILSLFLSAQAAVPVELHHTGRLLDTAGVPVDGLQAVTISLFDSLGASSPLWTESNTSVSFDNGYFAIDLGGVTSNPLDVADLDQAELWVELELNGSTLGRQRVVSVPFAVLARTAVDLDGGVVDASEIRVNGQLVIDSSGALAGGSTLGGLSCNNANEIAVYDGSAWGCVDRSWTGLSDVPSDLLDGDADSLAAISCLDGQLLAYNLGAGIWICANDAVLSEADVDAFVADNGFAMASDLVSLDTSLATIAKSGGWTDIANRPAGLDDGDDNTQLDEAAVDAFVANNGYALGADLSALDSSLALIAKSGSWADLLDIPPDTADGDDNTQLDEAAVDAFVANNGYALASGLAPVASSGDYNDLTNLPTKVIWSAFNKAALGFGAGSTLAYDGVNVNLGGAYNPNTGVAVVPVPGVYRLCTYTITTNNVAGSVYMDLFVNGNNTASEGGRVYAWNRNTAGDHINSGGCALRTLVAGDTVAWVSQDLGVYPSGTYSYMDGQKVD